LKIKVKAVSVASFIKEATANVFQSPPLVRHYISKVKAFACSLLFEITLYTLP
jgi:hypothetical protein